MRTSTASTRRWTAAATSTVFLAGFLAGCGGSAGDQGEDERSQSRSSKANGIAGMEAPQALRTAIKAHRGLEDTVYEGRTYEFFGRVIRAADARLTATARACEFKLSSGHLGRLTTRYVEGTRYTKGDRKAMAAAYELPPTALDVVGNRWLSEPASDEVVCDHVERTTDDIEISECLPGPEGEVDGVPTVAVRCRKHIGDYLLHIATTGKPLVLRMEAVSTSGDDLTLVSFDSGVRITAPPKRDVIDTTALQ